jgi:integrase
MAKLTPKFVEHAKSAPKRKEIPDAGCPGMYLVIQPSGAKSYAVRYRRPSDKSPAKLTIGSAAKLTLADARAAATAAKQKVTHGIDPCSTVVPSGQAGENTIAKLAEEFIEKYAKQKRPNTERQYKAVLRNEIVPVWGNRHVPSIARRDVVLLCESIAATKPIKANRVLAVLSVFFGWLLDREIISASPCVHMKRPGGKEKPRKRALSDDELRRVWLAAHKLNSYQGTFVKLLILLGQRRSEIGEMTWNEVNLERAMWKLPAARAKNDEENNVPLPPLAVEMIGRLPRIQGEARVLPTCAGGYGQIKARIDEATVPAIDPWRLHDLRRSVATGLARIGIAIPVIERLLNHKSGTFRGIVGVYQQHAFEKEKRVAVEKWADHIQKLVGGPPHPPQFH